MFQKRKKIINMVIDDYCIRLLESTGGDLQQFQFLGEFVLSEGVIERGIIQDELAFYHFMKDIVRKLKIRNRYVRFYVPSSLVIMRQVDIPRDLNDDELKDHIMLEIGNTIHLPFPQPIFDLHRIPKEHSEEQGRAILFAVPAFEVKKYTEVFLDVSLKPIAADVRSLGAYRYFQHLSNVERDDRVYLFIEWNITSTTISIFQNHAIEFLRYNDLEIERSNWISQEEEGLLHWGYEGEPMEKSAVVTDQIREFDRIINFYQFSLHQGEKSVDEIVVYGDYPYIDEVIEEIEANYPFPVRLLQGMDEKGEKVGSQFVSVLGLALKGGNR